MNIIGFLFHLLDPLSHSFVRISERSEAELANIQIYIYTVEAIFDKLFKCARHVVQLVPDRLYLMSIRGIADH
jgi:hypothetical protein